MNTPSKLLACRETAHYSRVRTMMQQIRQLTKMPDMPSIPTIPDGSMIVKQAKLVLEETMELLEACGIQVVLAKYKKHKVHRRAEARLTEPKFLTPQVQCRSRRGMARLRHVQN